MSSDQTAKVNQTADDSIVKIKDLTDAAIAAILALSSMKIHSILGDEKAVAASADAQAAPAIQTASQAPPATPSK